MTAQLVINLTCYESDSSVMFEMFILIPDADSRTEFVVHSRRTDSGSDFSFKTSKVDMIEYYVKSFVTDYDQTECSWLFDAYFAELDSDCAKFHDIKYITTNPEMAPVFDYYIEINDLKTHINNCLKFMQNIEVIPQDDIYADLPDLIPLSLEEMNHLRQGNDNPEIALDQIYEDTADDVVFVAN